MGYFLLAPEFVIFWAARQHYAARRLTKKHEKNHTGWTRAHSFFLIMGGFMLHEGGKPVQVLKAKELEELSKAGKIKWPTITKEEIADRSKGDYLSKTIVLSQTTWFVGQCIARGAYGLTVTELEVVTIAFASLTGVIYYLWWDKPLDARCSIPVHLLDGRLGKTEGDIEKEETGAQMILAPKISAEEIPERNENVVVNPNPLPTTSIQLDSSTLGPAGIQMGRFRDFRRRACEEYGTLFGLGYVFIGFPLQRFFGVYDDMADCDLLRDKSLRVPTFYSPYNEDDPQDLHFFKDLPFFLAVCVATVFGAIHSIPWSFHFPTLQELWVWRISAILVSGLPIFAVAVFEAIRYNSHNSTWMEVGESLWALIFLVLTSLYIIARIILLILPFVTLRALPPGAYVQLHWVSFLPHI